MSFAMLGSEYPDETHDLSDAAYRLHTDALCYSAQRLLDLLIPARDVPRIGWMKGDRDAAVAELLEAGWWERQGDHYLIDCRFGQWQKTRAWVETKRANNAKRQRQKRLRERHARDDHSLCGEECLPADDSVPDSVPESWSREW